MDLEINYNEQMLNYYPEVIKAIREFRVLIESQSLQVEHIHDELVRILSNAYISEADENRIAEWEQCLGIVPLPQGEDSMETWLSDRRETILARLYTPEKLNSKSISELVSIFTGAQAESYFDSVNSTIHVVILPPSHYKDYKLENLERELSNKIPAHLTLNVTVKQFAWGNIKDDNADWEDVRLNYANWEKVKFNIAREIGKLDVSTLENFVLDRG